LVCCSACPAWLGYFLSHTITFLAIDDDNRGGLNNKHSGNERLRQLARQYGGKYKSLTKKEKSDLSRYLVRRMRELVPPARYEPRVDHTCYLTYYVVPLI
jgi:hypothetical protein